MSTDMDLPEPVALIHPRHLAARLASMHCITRPEYRSASDAIAGLEYVPVYTADQMRAVIADLHAAYGHSQQQFLDMAAELEALRADAERYRWLRGGPDVPPESNRWARWEVRHWCGRWWNTMFAEALDAAIDAARAGGVQP